MFVSVQDESYKTEKNRIANLLLQNDLFYTDVVRHLFHVKHGFLLQRVHQLYGFEILEQIAINENRIRVLNDRVYLNHFKRKFCFNCKVQIDK